MTTRHASSTSKTGAQRPLKVFKAGGIRAAIWQNTIPDSEVVTYSVQIDRTYKHEEQFRTTSHFKVPDLPRVELVAREAFAWLSLRREEEDPRGSSFPAPTPPHEEPV